MNVFEQKFIRTNHLRSRWNENITQNKSLTGIAINILFAANVDVIWVIYRVIRNLVHAIVYFKPFIRVCRIVMHEITIILYLLFSHNGLIPVLFEATTGKTSILGKISKIFKLWAFRELFGFSQTKSIQSQ